MPATIFTDPIFPGAKIITASLTVTNTSGSYSTTVTDDRMTGAMKAISLEIDDPSIFNAKISVNATAGKYTFSCSDVAGSTTVVISFVKTADDPTELTSSEFDVLNNRIGDLTTLTTTAKTSAVSAINEVKSDATTINETTFTAGNNTGQKLKRVGKICTMSLEISTAPLSANTVFATLPAGYRPKDGASFPACVTTDTSFSNFYPCLVVVATDGTMFPRFGSNMKCIVLYCTATYVCS